MKRKYHTNEELINELHRFYNENGRVPIMLDMTAKNGYPHFNNYRNRFKTWNNALEAANLPLNQYQNHWQDGTETCSYCGRRADEISGFRQWLYPNGIRYCEQHGQGQDYIIGNLDINSPKGLGRAGEILVVKTLVIGKEHDYNRETCHAKIDMWHKDYDKIDVKISLFSYKYNSWQFDFGAKKEADTYICIGLSSNRSIVEHVWIVPNESYIRNLQKFFVYSTYRSLSTHEHWEVDAKPYNDMWKTMKLKTCNSMTDKSKPRVKLTWEEAVKKAAEIRKEIELRKLYDGD